MLTITRTDTDTTEDNGMRKISVAVAFLVGGVGLTSLMARALGSDAGALGWIAALELENLGFVIAGVLVLTWFFAMAYWKLARVEARYGEGEIRPMMICKADFEELFPEIFRPSDTCIARGEDAGGRPRPLPRTGLSSGTAKMPNDAKFPVPAQLGEVRSRISIT